MLTKKALVIAAREYTSRIKSKGFWIGTLAIPLLMTGLIFLPMFFLSKSSFTHHLVVVDESGAIGDPLTNALEGEHKSEEGTGTFEVDQEALTEDFAEQKAALNKRIMAGEIDAWIWIPEDIQKEGQVGYHAGSVSNFITQSIIRKFLTKVVREVRFEEAGYDPKEIGSLLARVQLNAVRVTEEGEKKENMMTAFIVATLLALMLYMLLVLYGQQILTGVIEEKTSRVVEVLLSSISTFDLMLGKLIGIGLVGLTQVAIWIGTALVFTAPALMLSVLPISDGIQIPQVSPWIAFNFVVFFLLGYFIYCTFYAAIGAAFNNIQEAQQSSMIGVGFLIVPLLMISVIVNNPDSMIATVMSLIPPFTPILMMLRIVAKTPPLWQILLSYVLTGAFALFMVIVSARVYRIGVLMYGKKPNLREILRWARRA